MKITKKLKHPYLKPDRLADVMALIQVLALHPYRHRSDKGLKGTIQGDPRSAETWEEIAQDHPEFFRVSSEDRLGVSLISRHVLPEDENGKRELPPGFIGMLLQTAISLHDRHLERFNHWKIYIPIIVAVTAGLFTILGAFINIWLTPSPLVP